jgi:DNA-binding XRE family transcriptional regulator
MKLVEARARALYSASALAKAAGMSRASIYDIEGGKWLPSLETVRKLCEVLQVDPMDVDEFRAAIDKTVRGKVPAGV